MAQSWTDKQIARVCIKGIFPESLWEPEGNIEQLTTIMLDAHNKELETHNPEVTLAENTEDTESAEIEKTQRIQKVISGNTVCK